MSTSFFGAPAPKKATKTATKTVTKPAAVTRAAAVADRQATANIPAVKTLPASQLTRITSLPAIQFTGADTQAYQTPAAPVDNGTGQVQYGAETVANPAPATPDTSIETLMKSPEYLARERALAAAMEQFAAGQATEAARYGENYNKSLAELGYDPTSAKWDLGELMSSGQRATTSGKAYDALRNDFASRGMLQSGAYQAKRGILSNQLNDQLGAVQQAKVRFGEDQAAKLTAQQAQNEQQRLAALETARQSILNSMGA